MVTSCAFFKIYCPKEAADALLKAKVLPFAEEQVREGGFDRFFFLTFFDPKFHIRLRLFKTGSTIRPALKEDLRRQLLGLLGNADGIEVTSSRYHPEWARYGGMDGVRLFEKISSASSLLAGDFLNAVDAPISLTSRFELALVTGELMAISFGLSAKKRHLLFRSYRSERKWGSQNADATAAQCDALLNGLSAVTRMLDADPKQYYFRKNRKLYRALEGFSERMTKLASEFRRLAPSLAQSIDTLLRAYLHLHFNRLGLELRHERLLLTCRAILADQRIQR